MHIFKDDKFERKNPILGEKMIYTYTGTLREVKGVNFYFFTDENNQTSFWTPSEVETEFTKL